MAAKIITFNGMTRHDLPPDRILEEAKGELEGCLILGFDKEDRFYFASSYADGGLLLWLMEACKAELMSAPMSVFED